MAKPNPRAILLRLLLASPGKELAARDAVAGCALFGIAENTVRVTLVRLAGEQKIEAAGRGAYRLASEAAEFAAEVAAWRRAEARVRAWKGDWIAAYAGALARSNRTALRVRERGLGMLGLRELERGLFVRPNNLAGGVAALRARIHKLVPEFEAPIFALRDLDADREQRARSLWDGRALNAAYIATRRKLEDWLARAERLTIAAAARESYLLGDRAIRQIVFDPLLPDPLVDVDARRACHAAVLRFDRAGHVIWQAFQGATPRVMSDLTLH